MDSTTRFSDRVADYVRWRPDYPAAVVDWIWSQAGLGSNAVSADVGAGTGIFTRHLLARSRTVYAVEPNGPMRAAAAEALSDRPWLEVLPGTAEATGLPDASVDLVTAAQSFHWFDQTLALAEFRRILKPGGRLALIWNSRLTDSPMLAEYEAALQKFAPEYPAVRARDLDNVDMNQVFQGDIKSTTLPNHQSLDLPGLKGRLQSASYVPRPGQAGHEEIMAAATEIFKRHAVQGRFTLTYQTQVWLGVPSDRP